MEKLVVLKFLEKIPKFLRWLYSFILINIGWIIFRIEGISRLKCVLLNLFKFENSDIVGFLSDNYELLNKVPFVVLGMIFSFPILNNLNNRFKNNFIYVLIVDVGLVGILILSVFFLINDSYNPFIYFRF
jgi:alginate O-acetyltransferase complex protein AlgI